MPKKSALSYAYALLARRDYSELSLIEQLNAKGYSRDEINEAVTKLKSSNFLDDYRTATNLLRYAIHTKYLGKRGIKSFLLTKGISDSTADKVIVDVDEHAVALDFACKKIKGMTNISDEQKRRRLYNALRYKGFSEDIISEVIKTIFTNK